MIFGRLSFPGARWYLVTVWVPQMVRDEKKFGSHWSNVHHSNMLLVINMTVAGTHVSYAHSP